MWARAARLYSRSHDELLDRTPFDSIADANDQLRRPPHDHVRPDSGTRDLSLAELQARHLSLKCYVAQ